MKTKSILRCVLNLVVLTGSMFLLSIVDFVNFTVDVKLPFELLLVSMLKAGVLTCVILNSCEQGRRLMSRLFLSYYSVETLMVAIEAVYLPETLPSVIVVTMLINGGIRALVFSVISVLLWENQSARHERWIPSRKELLSLWKWLGKFVLIGIVWAILFALFGGLVFIPLGNLLAPEDLAHYTNLDMPAWVLPFQIARGMVWALLTMPLISSINRPRWKQVSVVALFYGVVMGSNLLLATDLPAGLRIAHLVEVVAENFMFGAFVTIVLTPKQSREDLNVRYSYA